MSEAILKKKTRHLMVPISGRGTGGFSLNGGYRNKGVVGTTNLARSSIRTIYRGAYATGAGGCCGTFVKNPISNGSCCTNDSTIIKRSNMNTKGLILATIKHPTPVFVADCSGARCPRDWVKDFNPLNSSQSMFIRQLKIKNICPNWLDETITCGPFIDHTTCKTVCTTKFTGHPNTQDAIDCDPNCTNKSYFIGTKKVVRNTTTKTNHRGALDSSDFTTGLFQAQQCLPPPPCKQPFPMTIRHDGCDTNYLTPEEALEDGALPKHWGHCIPDTHPRYRSNPYTSTLTIIVGPDGIYNPLLSPRWLSLQNYVEGAIPGELHHIWSPCWNCLDIKIVTGGGGGGGWQDGSGGGGGGQGTVGTFRIGKNPTPGLEHVLGTSQKLGDLKISITPQKAGIQCAGGAGGSGTGGQTGMYGWVQLFAVDAAPFANPIADIFLNGGAGGSYFADASGGAPPPAWSQSVDWRYPDVTFVSYGGLDNAVAGRGNYLTGVGGNNPDPIIVDQVVGGQGGITPGEDGTVGGAGNIQLTFFAE